MKDGWKNKTMWTSDYNNATKKYVGKSGIPTLQGGFGFDLAVKGLAGGMKLKSDTTYKYETIKEDAKDLLEEAKVQNEGE